MTPLRRLILLCSALAFLSPAIASAHQPRLVEGTGAVIVPEPEVSKAYYDELRGEPRTYVVESTSSFTLYVNLLVPLTSNPAGRYGAIIEQIAGGRRMVIASLDPRGTWKNFYEPFGADHYMQGPEWQQQVEAGRYEITVSGMNNRGKYVLAVGQQELFPPSEGLKALLLIPQLKSDFFHEPRITFALSMFGAGELIFVLIASLIAGWLLHLYAGKRQRKKSGAHQRKNIGTVDRLLRLALAALFLLVGLWLWSMLAIFLGGFCLYEALVGWCGFFALLGKSSCRITSTL